MTGLETFLAYLSGLAFSPTSFRCRSSCRYDRRQHLRRDHVPALRPQTATRKPVTASASSSAWGRDAVDRIPKREKRLAAGPRRDLRHRVISPRSPASAKRSAARDRSALRDRIFTRRAGVCERRKRKYESYAARSRQGSDHEGRRHRLTATSAGRHRVHAAEGSRPQIQLHGKAPLRGEARIRRIALALTHTAETAMAQVVAELKKTRSLF